MPFRWEPSPEERLEYMQRLLDVRHEFDVALDRDSRYAPAPLMFCPTCGRTVDAQLTCPACGDESEMAAA